MPEFAVLFVCTANMCRSPLTEFLARGELAAHHLSWSVSSAGTRAVPGRPMHPKAARLLARRGLEPDAWSSRVLTADLIEQADLILTAAEEHRAAVAQLSRAAASRVYTLRQFAHLVAQLPPQPLPTADYGPRLLSGVRALRGLSQPPAAGEEDLPDPMGRSSRHFRACATTIDQALSRILSLAAG